MKHLFAISLSVLISFSWSQLSISQIIDRKPSNAKVKKAKPITKAEACRQFEKKYIAYYSDIFFVEKCERRLVIDETSEFNAVRAGLVIEVEKEVIQAIPRGAPAKVGTKQRSCKELNGRYVTTQFVDIYYISECKKHYFPEWDIYLAHSQTKPKEQREILEITDAEMKSFKEGKPMPSLERQDDEIIVDRSTIDLLPIKEACKGLEGRVVAFYGAVYKIEKCRKRPIVGQVEVNQLSKPGTVLEISPSQWFSLPKGKPIGEEAPSATEEESMGSDFIEEESL